MKSSFLNHARWAQTALRAAIFLLAAVAVFGAASNSVLIRNATIHPVTKPEIQGGSVLVIDGKIVEVGTKIPARANVRIVDGRGLHVYPGMINAATNVGLEEIESLRDSIDLDEIGVFNPQLRAEIAFNPSSEHIAVTRAAGVTTVVSLPSGGIIESGENAGIIKGQAALMHLDGWTWEDMAVLPSAALDMVFPQIRNGGGFRALAAGGPRTFADRERELKYRLERLSEFFEDARRYQKAKAAGLPDFRRDLKLEAMLPVIEGKRPIFVRAERERDIKAAIEFADKEKVRMILADPREIGTTGPLLKQRNIPVVLGDVLELPLHNDDPYDSAYTLPEEFHKAGIKICFGTFDVEFARNVPFQAAAAVAFGLPYEEALKALTINSAEIFGVSDRIGSIEEGKLADLIITDGDPLEARTNIKEMFIEGREVSLESRHTREYEKWMKRP